MISRSIHKIPDGKLLKIQLNHTDEKINSIKITGDFFSYPEEGIEKIEEELNETVLEKKVIFDKITKIVKENNIEFIGLNVEGLTDGIMMCLK